MLNKIDLSKTTLPPIYVRDGKECYLDPIRQKLIFIKPEETVRQKVISFLRDVLHVPARLLTVEEPLVHYGVKSKDRTDIIVLAVNDEGKEYPLVVVECKAPSVALDNKAMNQMFDYSDALGASFVMLTNGEYSFCYRWDESSNKYADIASLPTYSDMLEGKYVEEVEEEPPERMPFDQLESWLKETWAEEEKENSMGDIGRNTPPEIAVPVFNLQEGLLDYRICMPTGDYGLFRLIEDYGVRMLSYGNASGGQFFGPYRSFLVDVNGSTEFFSVSVSAYGRTEEDLVAKTSINVAHDNEKSSHHSLQLVVDDNCSVNGNEVRFYHHGRIAIGRIGSGKKAELRTLVEKRYPSIIDGSKYYLGKIQNNHLLRLNEPDVINLLVNLISYSIIRDEYRDILKSKVER